MKWYSPTPSSSASSSSMHQELPRRSSSSPTTTKYPRQKRRSPSITEEEYVYKELMPKYGQFVVTLASFDDVTHIRFLQQFFKCNALKNSEQQYSDTMILYEQRPKLYRFYGLARSVFVNEKLLNVTTFPCSMWGPFPRRLALFKHCAFAIIVFSLIDVESFEKVLNSWIFRNRFRFKETQIFLIGMDAEYRYCSSKNMALFTNNSHLLRIHDVIWKIIFDFCSDTKSKISHRIDLSLEPTPKTMQCRDPHSHSKSHSESDPFNKQFRRRLRSKHRNKWRERIRTRMMQSGKDEADRDKEDEHRQDEYHGIYLKKVIMHNNDGNSIDMVTGIMIEDLVNKYDLEYFECFNSEQHVNQTMHHILESMMTKQRYGHEFACHAQCNIL